MRRAIAVVALILLATVVSSARVSADPQVVERINAIGLLDYSLKPNFKVGDWVRYHMSGQSQLGMHDDYDVTVLIAGEEVFWGDKGFWVETWTDAKGRPPETVATLMSYSIFGDTLSIPRMQLYQRKTIAVLNDDGTPREEIVKPASSFLKSRNAFTRPIMWNVDTLEADTVQTPMGVLHTRKVSIKQGTGVTASVGDSSIYNEQRENRLIWRTTEVPLTAVAREQIESIISRRSWMIGRSGESAPMRDREHGMGEARLVGFGHGLAPRLVPADRRLGTTATPAAAAATPRRAGARRAR